MLEFITNAGRFDVAGSLIYAILAGGLIWAASRVVLHYRFSGYCVRLGASNVAACGVVLAFLIAIALFTVTIGATEPVSYVRLSSFLLPLMLAITAIVWQVTIVSVKWPWGIRGLFAYLVPIVLTCVTLAQAYDKQKPTRLPVLANAVRFVDGQYSIDDAYKDQSGWPALPDSRAIRSWHV